MRYIYIMALSKKIIISLPTDLLAEIDKYAKAHNYNRSEFIRFAIRRVIEQNKKDDKSI